MSSAKFHFEDIDENPIDHHDFGDLKRGKTGPLFLFNVVNDGPSIPMMTIRIPSDLEPQLSLPESEHWGDEVNFPLPLAGKQLVKVHVIIPSDAYFNPGQCILDAVVNLNFNHENL